MNNQTVNRSIDPLDNLFTDLEANDPNYKAFRKEWSALANFLTDYEHLKGLGKVTQSQIANALGTSQSAFSRIERMKDKPSYELLCRLSNAAGGELFITPLADLSVTLPYDLHDIARLRADELGITTKELLKQILRNGLVTTSK